MTAPTTDGSGSSLPVSVYTRHVELGLHIAPAYLAQPMEGVREQLNRSMLRYVEQLDGVLLSYAGLRLLRNQLHLTTQKMIKDQAKVFEHAEDTAAKYQERIAAERKAREEAAQDIIFGLESVFSEPAADGDAAPEGGDAAAPAEGAAKDEGDLPFEA